MHASHGREVQSDLLCVTTVGAELAGPDAQDAGGQDLGDLAQALRRGQLVDRAGHGVDRRTGLRFRSPGARVRPSAGYADQPPGPGIRDTWSAAATDTQLTSRTGCHLGQRFSNTQTRFSLRHTRQLGGMSRQCLACHRRSDAESRCAIRGTRRSRTADTALTKLTPRLGWRWWRTFACDWCAVIWSRPPSWHRNV